MFLSSVQPWGVLAANSIPVMVTSILALATVGSAVLAHLVRRESGRGDLERMHREIDHTHGLVKQGLLSGQELELQLARLRELRRSLPKDDLRRG